MSDSKGEGRPSIQAILTTIISLAGFTLLYSIQSQQLSLAQQVGFAAVIVLVAVLLFTWVYAPSLGKWSHRRRRKGVAQKNYSELLRLCERFRAFVTENYNTPSTILSNIRNSQEFSSVPVLEPFHVDFISNNLECGIKMLKPNLDSFVWGVNSLVAMVRFYDDVYVCKPVTLIRLIEDSGKGSVHPSHRDDFNASRERFVGFLGDLEEFVGRADKELGQDSQKVGDNWTTVSLLHSWRFDRPKAL